MKTNQDRVASEISSRILHHSNALKKTKRMVMKSENKKALQKHHTDMINYYTSALQALRLTDDENESVELDESIIHKDGMVYKELW